MSRQIRKLKLVMMRLRELTKKKGENLFNRVELRAAIDLECGVSPVTYRNNKNALRRQGWIEPSGYKRRKWKITGGDLE